MDMQLLVLKVVATHSLEVAVDILPRLDNLVPFAMEDILASIKGTLAIASSAVDPSFVVARTSMAVPSSMVIPSSKVVPSSMAASLLATSLAIASYQVIGTSAAMVVRAFAILLPHQLASTRTASESDQLSYPYEPLTTIRQGLQQRT